MTEVSRITCEEAFRKLDDYVDRELGSEESKLVEEHLAICAACAAEYRFEASLLKGVRRKLTSIRLPKDTTERILGSLNDTDDPHDR